MMKFIKIGLWAIAYAATFYALFGAAHIENPFIAVPVVAVLVGVAWWILRKAGKVANDV
jgi:hypothetical protein